MEQGQLYLPAEGRDAGMFDDHLGSDLPLLAQGAALPQCEHVVADLTDGTQGPALLGWDRPREFLERYAGHDIAPER